MGHIGGTQPPPDPVPKHYFILKRDGRYYFRQRIPADLVRALSHAAVAFAMALCLITLHPRSRMLVCLASA